MNPEEKILRIGRTLFKAAVSEAIKASQVREHESTGNVFSRQVALFEDTELSDTDQWRHAR